MSEPTPSVADTLAELRTRNPLVHSITNLVAMDLSANVLLAVGASPVMAHAREEIDEIVTAAHALVVNIGTLDAGWVESMEQAASKAGEVGPPPGCWTRSASARPATAMRSPRA